MRSTQPESIDRTLHVKKLPDTSIKQTFFWFNETILQFPWASLAYRARFGLKQRESTAVPHIFLKSAAIAWISLEMFHSTFKHKTFYHILSTLKLPSSAIAFHKLDICEASRLTSLLRGTPTSLLIKEDNLIVNLIYWSHRDFNIPGIKLLATFQKSNCIFNEGSVSYHAKAMTILNSLNLN